MDVDWGGQGSATMPTGSTCGDLGTDKCAQIAGSGSSTSTMGVAGMGTTFIQTIDVQNLNMSDRGGRVNYTIKVHKQDNADSIYMHITGRDGTTTAFAGTDLLSAAGVATGYAEYTGGFDFGGSLTSIIVEVGGRDINLAIGPVFDDVTVTALWNVVNTIVSLHITTIETFIATGGYTEEIIDIAEDIFDHNDFDLDPNGEIEVQPNFDDDMAGGDSYESIELELDMPDIDMDINMDMDITVDTGVDTGPPTNVEVTMENNIEMDIELEMDMPDVDVEPITVDAPPPEDIEVAANDMEDNDLPEVKDVSENKTPGPDEEIKEPQPEPEEVVSEPEVVEEPEAKEEEPKEEPKEEEKPEVKVAAKEEPKEKEEVAAKKEEKKEKPKETKAQQKQDQKQKAGSKIVKNMGDKGRYDSTNQLKTLLVMQVLGNSKTFFNDQKLIQDTPGFFSDLIVPDTQISDNNFASFIMFGGSNVKMDALVDSQYNQ